MTYLPNNSADTKPALKLDFNERSDFNNPILKDFKLDDSLWRYPDRQPLERRLAEINQLEPAQVVVTNGGDEAIMILMRQLAEAQRVNSPLSGAKLILPLPAFSQYTFGIESWQLDAISIAPKEDLSINLDSLKKQILANPGSITLLTRPNNPSGELIHYAEVIELLEIIQQVDGYLWLDEAYIEFVDSSLTQNEKDIASLISQYNHLIILRTLSKAYGLAGIRLGYLLAQSSLINQFKKRCMPFNISAPSIQIALQVLQPAGLQERQSYCKKIAQNRQQLCQWLSQNKIDFLPTQANFVMLQLAQSQAQAVHTFLAKNKIFIRPFKQDYLQNCLRITIPYHLDKLMPLLAQALTPELICMDMDGVLIDTSQSYDAAIKQCVNHFSHQAVTQADIDQLRSLGGYNNDWVLTQQLLRQLGVEKDLAEVTDAFQALYLGDNNNGLILDEKSMITSSFVDKINQDEQRDFAIVTGRPRLEAKIGQGLVNLAQLSLMSLDDVKQGKPDPEGITQLQKRYSSSSWMCGDNPDDMQAAVASASMAIGIGIDKQQALYAAGADIVLPSINQIEEWLWPSKSLK